MFSMTDLPILPALFDAPITATDCGLKRGSKLSISVTFA
jgi:hypothetical protein